MSFLNMLLDVGDTDDLNEAIGNVQGVLKWATTAVLGIVALLFVLFAIRYAVGLASSSDANDRKKHTMGLVYLIAGALICGIAAGFMPMLFDYFGGIM